MPQLNTVNVATTCCVKNYYTYISNMIGLMLCIIVTQLLVWLFLQDHERCWRSNLTWTIYIHELWVIKWLINWALVIWFLWFPGTPGSCGPQVLQVSLIPVIRTMCAVYKGATVQYRTEDLGLYYTGKYWCLARTCAYLTAPYMQTPFTFHITVSISKRKVFMWLMLRSQQSLK